jgi:hypothetical protein
VHRRRARLGAQWPNRQLPSLPNGLTASLIFQPVDVNASPFITPVSYNTPGSASGAATFAFDPRVPTSAYSTSAEIPEGEYFVILSIDQNNFGVYSFTSDNFTHSYSANCKDYFTGTNEKCSLYVLQVTCSPFLEGQEPSCAQATKSGNVTTVPLCLSFFAGSDVMNLCPPVIQ